MKAMLTSSLGGASKIAGRRVPSVLIEENGLLARLKTIWPQNANVLIVCADPSDYKKNDSLYSCLKESFPMSGLPVSSIKLWDERSLNAVNDLTAFSVIVLTGGHVPTQNRFFKTVRLKERLSNYDGIVVAWSAGSMNCADSVYAGPELEGEAVDPRYERWISGLGITNVNIFPHYQALKDDYLDGLRLMEDITFADSMGHEFIALNDGSYILIEGKHETLYGEAYMIKNGKITQICKDNESIALK